MCKTILIYSNTKGNDFLHILINAEMVANILLFYKLERIRYPALSYAMIDPLCRYLGGI